MQNSIDAKDSPSPPPPAQIAEGTYWLGERSPGQLLDTNSYLRRFVAGGGGGDEFVLLVDPSWASGPKRLLERMDAVGVGGEDVDAVFINHQDPDVSTIAAKLVDEHAPDAAVLCSDDTWELVHNYGIPEKQFVSLQDYPQRMRLPNGQVVVPVATPFCHFMGAMMLYDPEARVLYSGDLFSSLTAPEDGALMASKRHLAGMRAFHQMYMPAGNALRGALRKVSDLEPTPRVVAPHHGPLIPGEFLDEVIERLKGLKVGVELSHRSDDTSVPGWQRVLERVVDVAESRGLDDARELVDAISEQVRDTRGWMAAVGPRLGRPWAEQVVRLFAQRLESRDANAVRFAALEAAADEGLATPRIEVGTESDRSALMGDGGDANVDRRTFTASAGV